ncbi:amidase domain-containing protein [Caloranaerobacter sp. DY30410]|uniref:amidase domain-containing protein n=1 Tax=Caloranaerobacter sp. DY30410 TaxID=3238305 RepID=UPI003D02784E
MKMFTKLELESIIITINKTVNKAIYATSYNTPKYDKFISDCTNFASQILEAGGISQEDYSPDETNG